MPPTRLTERDLQIGHNLRRIRLFRDLSQQAVSGRMRIRGWSQSTLSRVEAGERSLTVGELLDLCDLYEVDPTVAWSERLAVTEAVR